MILYRIFIGKEAITNGCFVVKTARIISHFYWKGNNLNKRYIYIIIADGYFVSNGVLPV